MKTQGKAVILNLSRHVRENTLDKYRKSQQPPPPEDTNKKHVEMLEMKKKFQNQNKKLWEGSIMEQRGEREESMRL